MTIRACAALTMFAALLLETWVHSICICLSPFEMRYLSWALAAFSLLGNQRNIDTAGSCAQVCLDDQFD